MDPTKTYFVRICMFMSRYVYVVPLLSQVALVVGFEVLVYFLTGPAVKAVCGSQKKMGIDSLVMKKQNSGVYFWTRV